MKAAAQKYTAEALATLATIMRKSDGDAARVASAKELLDRGHGKSPQALIGGGENDPPIRAIVEVRRSIVDPREK